VCLVFVLLLLLLQELVAKAKDLHPKVRHPGA
jgi:hypothetical protein